MVAMDGIAVDAGVAQLATQRFAHPEVVNAPTGIVCTCSGAIRPPTVHLRCIAEYAERVNQSRLLPTIHPLALLGQEAADAYLPLRVVDVNGFVADIEVAADDHVRTFFAQFVEPLEEDFQKIHLELLTYVARCTAGHIDAHYGQIAEVCTQYSSLTVIAVVVHAGYNLVGGLFGEDTHARVTFLLSRMDIRSVTEFGESGGVDLLGLRFALLDAEHVRVSRSQPLKQSFAQSRANAVNVVRYEFHVILLLNAVYIVYLPVCMNEQLSVLNCFVGALLICNR